MTWPTTPINTTNLDNGADEPRLARADIKNMADAVNAMIDYGDPYNPESPVPIPIAILTGFFNDFTYTVSSEETQTISNVYWYKKVDLIGLKSPQPVMFHQGLGSFVLIEIALEIFTIPLDAHHKGLMSQHLKAIFLIKVDYLNLSYWRD
jgi:hypothetical protein